MVVAALLLAACSVPEGPSVSGAEAGPTTTTVGKARVWKDGLYEVGKEIKPGVYKTSGGGDLGGCYYARLSSDQTSDIIANNISEGPQTMRVRVTDAFVEFTGGCAWGRT